MTRRDGIGGSDVGAALGLDPRKTPYQLWREKTGLDSPTVGTAATRRGHFLEAAILARYCAEVQPASFDAGIVHAHNWQRGNQDGRAIMPDGQRRVVEAKSVSRHVFAREWGAAWSDEVPERVLCQGLWYAWLDGADLVDVPVAVVPDDPDEVLGLTAEDVMALAEFRLFRVQRNRDVEEWIQRRASAFWHDHVLAGVAPEAISIEDARLLWPTHTAGKVKPAVPVLDLIRKYDLLGQAAAERERIREELLLYAEDAEALVSTDGKTPLLTVKTVKRKGYTVAESESRQLRLTSWWKKAELGAPGTPKELTQPQQEIER